MPEDPFVNNHLISTAGENHCIKVFSFIRYHQIIKGTETKPEQKVYKNRKFVI